MYTHSTVWIHAIHCVSKSSAFKLSVTCQIFIDFQNFRTARKRTNLLQIPYHIARLTLGMLLHYPGKLKIQILCRCSADMEEKCKQIAFLSPLTLSFMHKFDIFSV